MKGPVRDACPSCGRTDADCWHDSYLMLKYFGERAFCCEDCYHKHNDLARAEAALMANLERMADEPCSRD